MVDLEPHYAQFRSELLDDWSKRAGPARYQPEPVWAKPKGDYPVVMVPLLVKVIVRDTLLEWFGQWVLSGVPASASLYTLCPSEECDGLPTHRRARDDIERSEVAGYAIRS
jgi:hypothetical protein